MDEPQARAVPPVTRKTGSRFLGTQALGRVGSRSLRTGWTHLEPGKGGTGGQGDLWEAKLQ